jgi:large conductance mechanosensitive channel
VKKFYEEFKAFINQGDVVMIAVGLIMALYFKAIVDAILDAIVKPLIALIFGKADLNSVGFFINKTFFSIGKVLDAAINFVVVAFILFLLVKAYNAMKKPKPGEPAAPTEVELLTEIRDALRNR